MDLKVSYTEFIILLSMLPLFNFPLSKWQFSFPWIYPKIPGNILGSSLSHILLLTNRDLCRFFTWPDSCLLPLPLPFWSQPPRFLIWNVAIVFYLVFQFLPSSVTQGILYRIIRVFSSKSKVDWSLLPQALQDIQMTLSCWALTMRPLIIWICLTLQPLHLMFWDRASHWTWSSLVD